MAEHLLRIRMEDIKDSLWEDENGGVQVVHAAEVDGVSYIFKGQNYMSTHRQVADFVGNLEGQEIGDSRFVTGLGFNGMHNKFLVNSLCVSKWDKFDDVKVTPQMRKMGEIVEREFAEAEQKRSSK